jgi:hypothetical protein
METKNFKCSTCGKTNDEVKFYPYLKSKCIQCKNKDVKHYRKSQKIKVQELEEGIRKDKRDEKLNEIDPDENIRYLCGEILLNEKIQCLRNRTLIEFIMSTEDELNNLFERYCNYKEYMKQIEGGIYKEINSTNDKINSLMEFKKNFDELVENRAQTLFHKYLNDNIENIAYKIKDVLKL